MKEKKKKKNVCPVWIKGVEEKMKNNISSLSQMWSRCWRKCNRPLIWFADSSSPDILCWTEALSGIQKRRWKGRIKKEEEEEEAKKRDRALAQTLVISGTTSIHCLRVVFTHWSCSPASCNFFPSTPRFLPRAIPNRPT